MTKTFTTDQPSSELSTADHNKEKRKENESPEPSERVISAILSYSRNLEVRNGQFVHEITYLKS